MWMVSKLPKREKRKLHKKNSDRTEEQTDIQAREAMPLLRQRRNIVRGNNLLCENQVRVDSDARDGEHNQEHYGASKRGIH